MGIELLLPIIIEKVVGLIAKPEAAQEIVKVVADNPEMAAGGSGVLLAAALFLLRKFIKTDDKMLKFRRIFVKAFYCVEVVYNGMKDFKAYMKNKCVGGVCELPEEKQDADKVD